MLYKLYSNCILVKGITRATICDLQKEKIYVVANNLADLFSNNVIDGSTPGISEFIIFLVSNNLVFGIEDMEESKLYPSIKMEWFRPSIIENAILDLNYESYNIIDLYLKAISELDLLGCRIVSMRFYDIAKIDLIDKIISHVENTNLTFLDILVKYTTDNFKFFSKCTSKRVRSVVFHSVQKNDVNLVDKCTIPNFQFLYDKITAHTQCGVVKNYNFSVNIEHFSESKQFNTCLNKKVSIDVEGNIKNCPSMGTSYGNIRDTPITSVIEDESFKRQWNIHKDQIKVCSSCEFRYVCSDCRAYLEIPSDLYSKPLKCGYNPVNNVWEEWSKSRIKESGIKHYNL